MNLIFLINGDRFSGAEKRILMTAIEMSKNTNLKITFFLPPKLFHSFNLDIGKIDVIKDYNSFLFSKNKIVSLTVAFFSRLRVLFIKKPTLYIALFSPIDILIGGLVKLKSGKVFYEITSPDIAKSKSTRLLLKLPFLYTKIVCASDNVKNCCDKYKKLSDSKIVSRTVPYVDNLTHISSEYAKKENIMLYSHRLIDRKNPILAAQSFLILAKKYKNWKFIICGTGKLEQQISSLLDSRKLTNVMYLGYRKDNIDIAAKSKIFLSLIEPDNYPSQSVLEALNLGCALIVSDTNQSASKFINNNGYAVKLSIKDIVQKTTRLIEVDNLETKCNNSKKLFIEKYSSASYFEESINIIQNK